MKIQSIDTKRRLVLPGAQPGEFYAVKVSGPGHYELSKVLPAPRLPRPAPAEIDALLASSALTPGMTSGELRSLTREP